MYSADMKLKKQTPKKITTASLRKWNIRLSVLHALQGILILILSAKSIAWPVTTSYLTKDTIASTVAGRPILAPASHTLFNINIAYLVALFFFLSAAAHLLLATKLRSKYESDLKRGLNRFRWIEYGFSASVMMAAIALLTGVYDFSSLLMIFMLTLLMNSLGLVMEFRNEGSKKTDWLPYNLGCVAGIVPWIVITIYMLGSTIYGSGGIPTFVYVIYGSMFVFFSSFALNMYLQYKKTGKWAEYLYGERVYMILSLVAKSALAWQVFFGTLRP